MVEKIQAIRGMNDILPEDIHYWQHSQQIFSQCLAQYGYREIRLPIVERTQLFKRTIGEVTDIVEKEMYTFDDLNGDSLTLRPEGTAGCVRACLEHGLLHRQQQKLWYCGPMFRHEKPQKGRYRQFYQLGVEALGMSCYVCELELIALCKRFWRALNIDQMLSLQVNTLGELSEREAYKQCLLDFLNQHQDRLDEDSKRRLITNPLRILDSKNPTIQALLQRAPTLLASLGPESKQRFDDFCQGLTNLGIAYTINPYLVRGLDYYSHTVFEWVTDTLGSQATVCAGGRYDALVKQLGHIDVPAVGFALGLERVILLMMQSSPGLENPSSPAIFIIAQSSRAMEKALFIAEQLHTQSLGWHIIVNTMGGSFKSQFKKADKSNANIALIIGETELQQNTVSIKNLRYQSEQQTIAMSSLVPYLQQCFGG